MAASSIEKQIRLSGILVFAGLLVQLVTMSWAHPLAFMAFLVVGCPLMLAGVLIYLYSLVTKS